MDTGKTLLLLVFALHLAAAEEYSSGDDVEVEEEYYDDYAEEAEDLVDDVYEDDLVDASGDGYDEYEDVDYSGNAGVETDYDVDYDEELSEDEGEYDDGEYEEEVEDEVEEEEDEEVEDVEEKTVNTTVTDMLSRNNSGCDWRNGWLGNHKLGMCYSLGKLSKKTRVNWYTAFSRCGELGGSLAEVRSHKQQLYLAKMLRSVKFPDSVWIAANDLMHKYMWTWSLNETALLGYTSWRKGEPNNSWNGGEDCVVLQVGDWKNKWKWNDVSCVENKIPFLCQRPPSEEFTFTPAP